MPELARKAFNIGGIWNLVCCHGNQIAKSILWNTTSRVLLQRISDFRYKLAEISLSSYLIWIWLSLWRHHFANLHILITWISLERNQILKISKRHFFFTYRILANILKRLRKKRCEFYHSSTLIFLRFGESLGSKLFNIFISGRKRPTSAMRVLPLTCSKESMS